MKKFISSLLVLSMVIAFFCACGSKGNGKNNAVDDSDAGSFNESAKPNEGYFVWEGNKIAGLTEEGAKQKSIIIPARCEGFTEMIFHECSVEHVVFEDDDDVVLRRAFLGAESVISVKLPANLTDIPKAAFKGAERLKSVVIPENVASIGDNAFSSCYSLEKIIFEGNLLKTINIGTFEHCKSLTVIEIPEGVEVIKEYAFADCPGLVVLRLSSTVRIIENLAFNNTGLKELHLPENIQLDGMQHGAFGVSMYNMVVYIVKDSWCDKNRSAWCIDFAEIRYE